MMITKKALPRRTFLRGVGVMCGLPLLDAMVPALTAMARTAKPTTRMLWTYVPNGILLEDWYPNGEMGIAAQGEDFKLSTILKPLEPFKDQLVAVQGLASPSAESRGNSRAPHTKCHTAYLSGARAKYTEGADFELGKIVQGLASCARGCTARPPRRAQNRNSRLILTMNARFSMSGKLRDSVSRCSL